MPRSKCWQWVFSGRKGLSGFKMEMGAFRLNLCYLVTYQITAFIAGTQKADSLSFLNLPDLLARQVTAENEEATVSHLIEKADSFAASMVIEESACLKKMVVNERLQDSWDGKRFNSPNDLAVHDSGAIYFTDPPYGLPNGFDDERREIDFCGVFRVQPNGEVDLLCKTMTRPNGIAFSPDQKKLYVAQSDPDAPILRVFNIDENGMLDAGKIFFDASNLSATRKGMPDGLAVDTKGNLFATGPGGVLVIAADGTHLGTILTGQKTANCCFGEDGRSLFMTADMNLCRIRLTTSGW